VYDESGVVRTVFHLCGDDVLETEAYKRFMARFGPDVHVSTFDASKLFSFLADRTVSLNSMLFPRMCIVRIS
jgi:hypothetical protein